MSTFRVIFTGQPTPDVDRDTAIASFARLLKCTPEQAAAAFNDKALVLKKSISREDADKMVSILLKSGLQARAEIESSSLALSLIDIDEPKQDEPPPMTCPSCKFVQPKADVCGRCGIAIAKFLQRQAALRAAKEGE